MEYWNESKKINNYCKEKIKTCKELNELFNLWKKVHKEDPNFQKDSESIIEKDFFIEDGYICEEKYQNVLFILKEPNIKSKAHVGPQIQFYKNFTIKKYRELVNNVNKNNSSLIIYEFDKDNTIKPIRYRENNKSFTYFDNIPKQKEKMARMAKFIIDKKITSVYSELKDALEKVAFMNINKRGGSNTCDNRKLNEYYDLYEDFIIKEIELLKPKTIVLMTKGSKVCNSICEKIELENSQIQSHDYKQEDKEFKILEITHTAARGKALDNGLFNEMIKDYEKQYEAEYIREYDICTKKYRKGMMKKDKNVFKFLMKFIYEWKT